MVRSAKGLYLALTLILIGSVGLVLRAADQDDQRETPEQVRARINASVDTLKGKTGATVVVARVDDEINLRSMAFLKRAVAEAKDAKADLFLLELNTPGGSGLHMEMMGKEMLSLSPMPTVCYVNTDAFSAGVYLAICCDRIYMSPLGKMGAYTPYVTNPQTGLPVELPKDVQSKMYRAAESLFRAVAQQKGYNNNIILAMGDPNAEPVLVEIDGKEMLLTKPEVDARRNKLKNELDGAEKELDKRIVVMNAFPKGPLVVTSKEGIVSGLVYEIVDTREELFDNLGLTSPKVDEVIPSWSERFFGFLAGPISGILLLVGLVGLYMELKTPGFGVFGVVGITCILLFLFSGYFVGLAGYTEFIIVGVGVVLLAIELFVTPGFGLMGASGIVLILVGLFLSRLPFIIPNPDLSFQWDAFVQNIITISLALIGFFMAAVLIAKLLPGIPILNRLVLKAAGPAPAEELVGSAGSASADVEVGVRGISITKLRPSGRALFGDKAVDVVAQGQFIEPGTEIEVLETKGNRIVVRSVSGRNAEKKT